MSVIPIKPSLLVADDELDVVTMISQTLLRAGFQVIAAEDGAAALSKARAFSPALIVLDVMMPGLNGFEVCKALKADSATAGISIIMLSAKVDEKDRVQGLEAGADDYLTKPFSPRELLLRIQSILSRKLKPERPSLVLRAGTITVDQDRHLVSVGGTEIDLTVIEFKLLVALLEGGGRVRSREDLLNQVWGYDKMIETRTIDTHMRRLREKLGEGAEHLKTVRSFGYRISQ